MQVRHIVPAEQSKWHWFQYSGGSLLCHLNIVAWLELMGQSTVVLDSLYMRLW